MRAADVLNYCQESVHRESTLGPTAALGTGIDLIRMELPRVERQQPGPMPDKIRPHFVHAHFVTTTMRTLRHARRGVLAID